MSLSLTIRGVLVHQKFRMPPECTDKTRKLIEEIRQAHDTIGYTAYDILRCPMYRTHAQLSETRNTIVEDLGVTKCNCPDRAQTRNCKKSFHILA